MMTWLRSTWLATELMDALIQPMHVGWYITTKATTSSCQTLVGSAGMAVGSFQTKRRLFTKQLSMLLNS